MIKAAIPGRTFRREFGIIRFANDAQGKPAHGATRTLEMIETAVIRYLLQTSYTRAI
jgi:hypothetical protein